MYRVMYVHGTIGRRNDHTLCGYMGLNTGLRSSISSPLREAGFIDCQVTHVLILPQGPVRSSIGCRNSKLRVHLVSVKSNQSCNF